MTNNKEIIKLNKEKSNISLHVNGFLSNYADTSQKMVKSAICQFSNWMYEVGISVDDIDQDWINIYTKLLRESGIKNGTYNWKISYLKKFLTSIDKKFEFKRAKQQAYEHSKLVSEQGFVSTLFSLYSSIELAKSKSKLIQYNRDLLMLSLYFLTALRKSEVLNLKLSHLSFENGACYYTVVTKGSKEVKKQYPAELIELTESLIELENKGKDDYLFTATRKGIRNRLNTTYINEMFNKYYKNVNGDREHVTVHSIRNLSGLAVKEITGDMRQVKAHLNHANLNQTDMYIERVEAKSATPYSKLFDRIKQK